MMYTRNSVVVMLCACALVGVAYAYIQYEKKPHARYEEAHARWVEAIQLKGGPAAYEDFARKVRNFSQGEQHEGAHVFGGALFEALGEKGVSVCDARFSYGCFHEFLARAVEEGGVTSIPHLNDACFTALVKSPLSCQHGIGHGALAAVGYAPERLPEALALCAALRGSDAIGGCYGGVFMEYNTRTMWGDSAEYRALGENAYEPCDNLDARHVPACIYWQPQWWTGVFPRADMQALFVRMGELCRSFTKEQGLLRQCIEGIGNIAPQQARYGASKAGELCDAAAHGETQRLVCRSTAANVLRIDAGAREAEAMCTVFTREAHDFCMAYARNEAHTFNRRSLPSAL